MIVYSGLKTDFLTAVEEDSIASEIEEKSYYRRSINEYFRTNTRILCGSECRCSC